MSEPLDLDAIEARVIAATTGPWAGFEDETSGERYLGLFYDGGNVQPITQWTGDQEDAEFIAHSRTDVPALVARIRELEPRVLEGDWETVRDALDALPEGATIRWRANGRRALPTLGIKITNIMGHASWSTTGLGILKAESIARDETPIEVIA